MKPVVILDNSLFSVPNCADSGQELEQIINSLLEWSSRSSKRGSVQFAIADDLIDILYADGLFPFTKDIEALLDIYGLNGVYSARDLSSKLLLLLERSETLANVLGSDVEVANTVLSEPLYDGTGLSAALQRSIEKQWATAAVAATELSDFSKMIFFVPGRMPAGNIVVDCDVVSGSILSARVSTGARSSGVSWVRYPQDLLNLLVAEVLWGYAQTASELHFAVSVAARQRCGCRSDFLPSDEFVPFTVGDTFLSSLPGVQAQGFQPRAAVCLNRCALLVIQHCHGKDFSEVRVVDNAQSKRIHVTSRHEAIRLLYWRLESGAIELANFGNKFALEILHGNPSNAAASAF